MKIKLGRTYKTRGGHEATIGEMKLLTNGHFPVTGKVRFKGTDKYTEIMSWDYDGRHLLHDDSEYDIIGLEKNTTTDTKAVTYHEHRDQIFTMIHREQIRASRCWELEADSKKTLNDWIAATVIYLGQAVNDADGKTTNLVKAANLLINAAAHIDTGTVGRRRDK